MSLLDIPCNIQLHFYGSMFKLSKLPQDRYLKECYIDSPYELPPRLFYYFYIPVFLTKPYFVQCMTDLHGMKNNFSYLTGGF